MFFTSAEFPSVGLIAKPLTMLKVYLWSQSVRVEIQPLNFQRTGIRERFLYFGGFLWWWWKISEGNTAVKHYAHV